MRFQSKVVLIVGASGGLGTAIAEAFFAEGARLILAARQPTAIASLAARLNARLVPLDLTDSLSLSGLPEKVRSAYGSLDIVVNATGYDVRKPLHTHTSDELRHTLEINLLGAMELTRLLLPVVGSGSIVHLGGFADGRMAFPFYSANVASRAGLRAFTESVNRELALEQRGAVVTFFAPNPADTVAEQPFHALWRAMGTPIVPPAQVAAELLRTVAQRRKVYIMGGALTVAFAGLNAVAPALADTLLMHRYGSLMNRFFSGKEMKKQSGGGSTFIRRAFGVLLVVLSTLAYLLLFGVPFLAITPAAKVGVSAAMVAFGEATFWIGAALLGREMMAVLRRIFNVRAWFCCPRVAP